MGRDRDGLIRSKSGALRSNKLNDIGHVVRCPAAIRRTHGQRLDVDAICGEAVKWYDVLDCIMDSVRVPNESSGAFGRGYNPGEP